MDKIEDIKFLYCIDCDSYIKGYCAIDLKEVKPNHKACAHFTPKRDKNGKVKIKHIEESMVDNAIILLDNYIEEVIRVRDGFLYDIKFSRIRFDEENAKEDVKRIWGMIRERLD